MKSIHDFRTSTSALGRFALVAGLTMTLFACRDAVAPVTPSNNPSGLAPSQVRGDRKIKDEYIVVFRSNVRDVVSEVSGLASRHNLSPRHFYKSGIKGFAGHMTAEVAQAVAQDPNVEYVEQNGVVSISSGTQSPTLWGLDRIDQATLPLSKSYSWSTDGSGVSVYIIDTGIRTTHTQFQGRAFGAFTSILDGRGPEGCHWHGTHVAGTVAGVTYGVARAAKVYSVRVLDCTGNGSDADVIAGIDWVTANAVKPAVANMSIGGSYSQAMNDAIQRSIASGVTYVVAAANDGSDACRVSPASAANAVTVGAVTNTDAQAVFSNWGTCVDLYAPGVDVVSAWNSDDYASGPATGTSMSSPHAAGAAALYLQSNPTASPAEVAAALASSATSGVLTGLGAGSPNLLLRVNGSVAAPAPAPPPAPAPAPPPAPVTNDAPPTADFSFKCATRKCTFDGRNSKDDRGIVSFVWSFGDGTTQATSTITTAAHDYAVKGKYSVTLKVVDAAGQSATRTKSVDSH